MRGIIIYFFFMGLSFASLAQQREGGVEYSGKSSGASTERKSVVASFTFSIASQKEDYVIKIFQQGVLYMEQSFIPGTSIKFTQQKIAEKAALLIIRKLKDKEPVVFSQDEIKKISTHK